MEEVPRSLLVLTGIVVLVAVYVGIRDHVKADARTSTSTTAGIASKATAVPKKTTSAKTRQARRSATEADATTTAPDDAGERRSGGESAKAGAEAIADTTPNTVGTPPAYDQVEALPRTHCVPLPNETKPGDVDVAYYQNWASEYGCRFHQGNSQHKALDKVH